MVSNQQYIRMLCDVKNHLPLKKLSVVKCSYNSTLICAVKIKIDSYRACSNGGSINFMLSWYTNNFRVQENPRNVLGQFYWTWQSFLLLANLD